SLGGACVRHAHAKAQLNPPERSEATSHARRKCAALPAAYSYMLEAAGAGEDELHDGGDGALEARVLDHGHVVAPRGRDDEPLDPADVVEAVHVLLDRPGPARGVVPDHEVARVRVLVLDREDALDDERVLHRLLRDHPGHEVHAL